MSYWHHLDRVRGVLPTQGVPVGLVILVVVVGLWFCSWTFTELAAFCGMATTEALRLNARRRKAWRFIAADFTHVGHLYNAQLSLGHEYSSI